MIKLTLYGPGDKPVKTLSRYSAKWSSLRRSDAIFRKITDGTTADDNGEMFDELCALVAEEFNGDATFDEIANGARIEDLMACAFSIMAEARKLRSVCFRPGAVK